MDFLFKNDNVQQFCIMYNICGTNISFNCCKYEAKSETVCMLLHLYQIRVYSCMEVFVGKVPYPAVDRIIHNCVLN